MTNVYRDEIIEQCALAAEQQDREGYEWVRDSLWQKILQRAGANVRKLKAQQPVTGDRRCDTNLVGGMGECIACDADQGEACRRPLVTKHRPDPELDRTLSAVNDAINQPGE